MRFFGARTSLLGPIATGRGVTGQAYSQM